MWEQEKHHKAKFEELVNTHRVRPSLLTPLWNIAGFVLGAGENQSFWFSFFGRDMREICS